MVQAAVGKLAIRDMFVKKCLVFSPTTAGQNEKWIWTATQGTNSETRFLHIENSQMKFLNDNLKDKNFITSVTNYYKKIAMRNIQTLKNEYAEMKTNAYSDFKSLRFSFNGKNPLHLQEHLARMVKNVNKEFSDGLRKMQIMRRTDMFDLWFRSGFGHSSDQANIAARYSRQLATNHLQCYDENSFKIVLEQKLRAAKQSQQNLRNTFEDTAVLDANTLHADVFDIVRKNLGNEHAISNGIKRRFSLLYVSSETVDSLQNYVKIIDEFQPSLQIANQEFANLNDAVFGGFSADVLGLGSENLKGTAEALAKSTNLEEIMKHSRAAEKVTTAEFLEQNNYFQNMLNKTVGHYKLKIARSGDDCVAMATKPLTEKEKKAILTKLNNSKYAGKYRLAFVAAGVSSPEARSLLSTHGESIEKLLRNCLYYTIDLNKLKNLTFGIDMQTSEVNQGDVKLILGESCKLPLTLDENWIVHQKFKDTIAEINAELRTQYRAIS